jgi:hypothetical protein
MDFEAEFGWFEHLVFKVDADVESAHDFLCG